MVSTNEIDRCSICDNKGSLDLPGGFFLRGKYICAKCEAELIKCKATDVKYQLYLNEIKKLWFKEIV